MNDRESKMTIVEQWRNMKLYSIWVVDKVYKADGAETAQLFDLAEDIGEKKDVAAAHPERVAKMGALLK